MKEILFCCISLFTALSFNSCKQSSQLDVSKLDTAYFVGVYQANYRGEIETIKLKENGKYDYYYGKDDDIIIEDINEWYFNKEQEPIYVYLKGFPNVRKNKVYTEETGKTYDMMMRIDRSFSSFGDLYALDHEEWHYTFVKLDKSKNKYYLIKQ